jgi:hypothetical protein
MFSEIPLDQLGRLVNRRSKYGIGFHQDVLVGVGGGRVWYLDSAGTLASNFRALISEKTVSPIDVSSPLWSLTPFVDFPGTYGTTEYRFEWEREWRVSGGLKFRADQVAFLFIPEDYHVDPTRFFSEAKEDNIGTSYGCPMLDPLWPDERIQTALARL